MLFVCHQALCHFRNACLKACFRTTMPSLPLELLHSICDFVAESEDHPTLRSYALVCPGLVKQCQRYLFSKVTLSFRGGGGPRSVQRLDQVLQDNETLGSYIKSLSVLFSYKGEYSYRTLPTILSKCTKICSFRLQAALSMMYPPIGDWPASFPDDTRMAVEAILYSPLLTELAVVGFHLSVPNFFSRCSTSLAQVEIIGKAESSSSDYHDPAGSLISPRRIIASPETMSCLLDAKRRQSGGPIFDLSKLLDIWARSNWQILDYVQSLNKILQHGAPVERLSLEFTGEHLSTKSTYL